MRLYKFDPRAAQQTEAIKKELSPWKLGGLMPWQLLKRVYNEFNEDEVFTRSAALAYYFVSALFPMIFFLMAMLAGWGLQFRRFWHFWQFLLHRLLLHRRLNDCWRG